MMTTVTAILASQGPFGPTPLTCVLLVVVMLGPFALLALAAWSLLRAEPAPAWLLGGMALGTAALGYFLRPWAFSGGRRGFWGAWSVAAIVAILLLPVVALWEAGKRGWFDRIRDARRRRRGKGDRGSGSDDP